MDEQVKAFQVRIPAKMYNRLTKAAKTMRRSLNAEIVNSLDEYFKWQDQWEEDRKAMETMTPERLEGINKFLKKLEMIEAYAKAHPDEFP